MIETSRRGFLLGLGAALAAPAIVKIENIMPVRNRLMVSEMWVPVYWQGHLIANRHLINDVDMGRAIAEIEVAKRRFSGRIRIIRAPAMGHNVGLVLPRRG